MHVTSWTTMDDMEQQWNLQSIANVTAALYSSPDLNLDEIHSRIHPEIQRKDLERIVPFIREAIHQQRPRRSDSTPPQNNLESVRRNTLLIQDNCKDDRLISIRNKAIPERQFFMFQNAESDIIAYLLYKHRNERIEIVQDENVIYFLKRLYFNSETITCRKKDFPSGSMKRLLEDGENDEYKESVTFILMPIEFSCSRVVKIIDQPENCLLFINK